MTPGAEAAVRALVAAVNDDAELAYQQFVGLSRVELVGALGFLTAGYSQFIRRSAEAGGNDPAAVLQQVLLHLASNERPNP